MLFSQRYHRAIEAGALEIAIPPAVRSRLWAWLFANNEELWVQRHLPHDRWADRTSILEEVRSDLMTEHALERLEGDSDGEPHTLPGLKRLFYQGSPVLILDALELASRVSSSDWRAGLHLRANALMEQYGAHLRMTLGEVFPVSADLMGTGIVTEAHDLLAARNFEGPAEEFRRAREYAAAGENRLAITFACHSFESTMKVICQVDQGNADALIRQLGSLGFFDDLPASVRASFQEQVLKTLPSLRNRLGGHGQGADVVTVPPAYANLALQLASTFHSFLLSKHLERAEVNFEVARDDNIPF